MNKNSLIVAVLILVLGIVASYYLKMTKEGDYLVNPPAIDSPMNQQDWNDWRSEEKPNFTPPIVNNNKAPESYSEALRISQATGKKMLLFFTADWCKYCKMMKAETLADPKVKEALSKHVVYIVNVDRERELAMKYKVRDLPCYRIVDSREHVEKVGVGFKKPNLFIRWIVTADDGQLDVISPRQ